MQGVTVTGGNRHLRHQAVQAIGSPQRSQVETCRSARGDIVRDWYKSSGHRHVGPSAELYTKFYRDPALDRGFYYSTVKVATTQTSQQIRLTKPECLPHITVLSVLELVCLSRNLRCSIKVG